MRLLLKNTASPPAKAPVHLGGWSRETPPRSFCVCFSSCSVSWGPAFHDRCSCQTMQFAKANKGIASRKRHSIKEGA
eukprot:1150306-Pelagomonas_calceolata.AAC.2